MPKIRNKITGEIIEIPDQGGGMQRVGPANTMRPLQEQGAALGNQRTQQQITADQQMLPLQVQKMQADLEKARIDAQNAQRQAQVNTTNTDKAQAEEARKAAAEARTGLLSMGHLYDISSRYQGGIPQAAIDAVKSGAGATDPASQDYRLFNSMAKRAAIGKAATLKPVSNTDIALLIDSGANPSLTARNNKMILGQDYQPVARALLENRMKANWIERYGSLSAKSPKGRTFGDAVRQAYQGPQVKSAMKSLDTVVKERSPKAKGKSGGIKFLGFE